MPRLARTHACRVCPCGTATHAPHAQAQKFSDLQKPLEEEDEDAEDGPAVPLIPIFYGVDKNADDKRVFLGSIYAESPTMARTPSPTEVYEQLVSKYYGDDNLEFYPGLLAYVAVTAYFKLDVKVGRSNSLLLPPTSRRRPRPHLLSQTSCRVCTCVRGAARREGR